MEEINNSMTPFGYYDNGLPDKTKVIEDSGGNKWYMDNAKQTMEEIGWMFDSYTK